MNGFLIICISREHAGNFYVFNISISNANGGPLESVGAMNQLPVVRAGRAFRTRHGIATDTIIECRPLSLKQKEQRDVKKAKSGAPPFHFPMTYLYPVLQTKINSKV